MERMAEKIIEELDGLANVTISKELPRWGIMITTI